MAPKRSEADTEAVLEQLERILRSDLFASGQRQCRFLRYVVESTLAGKPERLNQFAVGIEVFDRDESFDPSIDSIVRVEAGRLRSKLAEYYSTLGENDSIVIGLPKGGYAASIKSRQVPEPALGSGNAARRRNAVILLLLAVLLAGSVYIGFLRPPSQPQEPESAGNLNGEASGNHVSGESPDRLAATAKPAIAVLPFDNMSADPRQEYFSDGITEDIITDLSLVSGLTVIARHSTFLYKNRAVSIKDVGRELGVQYVLEGSVRRERDRLRVNAQLIDAATETHLWANRYDREVGHVFMVQDDVSRMIVSALELRLTDLEDERLTHRGTVSIEAHDSYLRAQEQFYRFDEEGVERSIELFSQSIALDSSYAEALAWKSRALVYAFLSGIRSSKEDTVDVALSLSRQAVEHDPLLPMAHASLAWAMRWDRKTDDAISAVETAIRLDSNYAEAYLWQSLILATAQRGEDSLSAVQQGMRLNPHYGVTYIFAMGRSHLVLGNLEPALASFNRGIQRNPAFIPNHVYKLFALEQLGRKADLESARGALARSKPDYRQSPSYRFYLDELDDIPERD